MGRAAEGWTLVPPTGRRKVYRVRFRWAGVRQCPSTGCTDPGEAAREAARLYAEAVSGRESLAPVSADLSESVALFLAHYGTQHAAGTTETAEMYFTAHVIPHFRSLARFTAPTYADYIAKRMGQVCRSTVRKELSVVRQFVAWEGTQGNALAAVPELPKNGHPGRRSKNARKSKATIIRPADVKRILAAMPERSRRTGAWVRPLFVVLWETGLRPITVLRLQAGEHYKRGALRLFISAAIDKENFERWVPLSPAARRALDRVYPEAGSGLLFDAAEDSVRFSLEAALRKAGLSERRIGVYDFKHSRISLDANSGLPLAGIAHMVGHTNIATTALYVTTGEDAARSVLKGRRA